MGMSSILTVKRDLPTRDDVNSILARIRRLEEDYKWIFSNIEQLREQYNDKFIAVKDKEIVFSSEDIETLRNLVKDSESAMEDFAIANVSTEERSLLF